MRHRIFGKKLGRNHNERKALFNAQTRSMFIYGSIQTTEAKAQAIVSIIESLSNTIITKPELMAKRELFCYLQKQSWVNNVVSKFKETFGQQTSNFTRITRVKRRYGDNALIVKLEFTKPVKFEKNKFKVVKEKTDKKNVSKKTTKKETK
jgi:large subunit ribosomal protein L17